MKTVNFTVEEENMVCIYYEINRNAVMENIRTALPDFDEDEMREIAENILQKLDSMSDTEFAEYGFTPAYSNDEN
jgi:hypothetical protein